MLGEMSGISQAPAGTGWIMNERIDKLHKQPCLAVPRLLGLCCARVENRHPVSDARAMNEGNKISFSVIIPSTPSSIISAAHPHESVKFTEAVGGEVKAIYTVPPILSAPIM